ncbi:MAG TPA: hypothetical protein PL041_03490 [Melioribacteraceae bacterium]|nr:hypothetical protein [Melioribacteraceae bacterium]
MQNESFIKGLPPNSNNYYSVILNIINKLKFINNDTEKVFLEIGNNL